MATRTSNAAELNPATAKIPQLWGAFMAEGWFDRLENMGATGPVIAVYSAYESDHTGTYRVLVGREVEMSKNLPQPLEEVVAASGAYLVFRSAGPMPQAVIDGWQTVWAYFEREARQARAYTFDLEIYDGSEAVDIWIAVRG